MKHIAAVLLLALGNKEINEKNINEVLASVGAKANANCIKMLVTACKGKKPEDIIKEGAKKLAAVTVAAAAAPAEHHDDKDNKKGGKKDDKKGKKEEKKKVEEEEEDMGFGGLF